MDRRQVAAQLGLVAMKRRPRPTSELAAAMRERCSAFAIDVLEEEQTEALDRDDVGHFAAPGESEHELPDEPPPGWE